MHNALYITGHKNPDTDSICSAIAYAELKKKLGIEAVPVRLGNLNRETEFVLKYFDVDPPEYLSTVRTQVSDLNIDIVNPASPDISIKSAWAIMTKNNFKVLPVVDENEKLLGVVTLTNITRKYMDAFENNIIATSNTPLQNIIETLNAKLLCGQHSDFKTSGRVFIAAMTPDEMIPFVDEGDIVMVGDRKENQMKAIELGANCIILTCGGSLDEEVKELAQTKGCIIMQTQSDTFTSARLIHQSIPIGYIMSTQSLIYFNMSDFIDNIKDRMLQTRFRSYPVVDMNHRVKGFISRFHLISQRKKQIVLLDHNEKSQTVDGIDQAEILEIIDHHRIGDIQTGNPIYFRNDPVGSTSTIIATLYFENGIKPSKKIAGILCAAIISDTLKFRSPTSTYVDEVTAQKLADIAGIKLEAFAIEMYKGSSSLEGLSPLEILNYDFKDFKFGKHKMGVGQVNSSDLSILEEMQDSLLEKMREMMAAKEYSVMILMVTDIFDESSEVLFVGREMNLLNGIFHTDPEVNRVHMPGIVSRKKQIVPLLEAAGHQFGVE